MLTSNDYAFMFLWRLCLWVRAVEFGEADVFVVIVSVRVSFIFHSVELLKSLQVFFPFFHNSLDLLHIVGIYISITSARALFVMSNYIRNAFRTESYVIRICFAEQAKLFSFSFSFSYTLHSKCTIRIFFPKQPELHFSSIYWDFLCLSVYSIQCNFDSLVSLRTFCLRARYNLQLFNLSHGLQLITSHCNIHVHSPRSFFVSEYLELF